jgi:predicted ribosomally synthesized peptide with SipW-like signal peptide
MTNATITKRALLSSALALFLCFTMLLGTTFAWFTDSVESGSNVITAGKLDITVEYTLDGTTWADLADADDLFQKDLWEPGHTEVVALRITNAGTLNIKYSINMNIINELTGKNKEGNDIVLSNILTVSTLSGTDAKIVEDAFANENGVVYGNTTSFKAANVLGEERAMEPGAVEYLVIKVDMAETVGNEGNHDGTNIPSIEFGVDVFATQYASEEDSFGKDYDAGAPMSN